MKWYILLFLLCLPFATSKANDNMKIVLLHKNGNRISYLLNKKPKLSFTNADIVVSIDNTSIDYPLCDILQLSYEDESVTSVSEIDKEDVMFSFDNQSLSVTTSTNCTVTLFSTNGDILLQERFKAGKNKFSLSSFNSGIYILNVNGVSTKIIKR